MLHRVRNTLERLDFPDSRKIILQKSGCYFWNTLLDCTTDLEEFDQLFYKIKTEEEQDSSRRLDYCLQAISLYRGYFLDGQYRSDKWASDLLAHYHQAFTQIYEEAASLLLEQKNHSELVSISCRAIRIDESSEPFHYFLTRAYIELSEPQKALLQYERATDLFFNVYHKQPSDRFRALYREISQSSNGVELDIGILKEKLRDRNQGAKPLFCQFETFQTLFQFLTAPHHASGDFYDLILLTLHAPGGSFLQPSPKSTEKAIPLLKERVEKLLSPGDLFTRYSVTQFLCISHFESEAQREEIQKKLSHEIGGGLKVEISVKITSLTDSKSMPTEKD
jgi:DNA-binding SARP family transcriptional activator